MTSQLPPVQDSIRASCDRCRAKKLACVVSTSNQSRIPGQQCERCIRARVQCVFSRRAHTRRGNRSTQRSNNKYTSNNTPTQRSQISGDPQQPAGTGHASIPSELHPGSSMDLTTLGPFGEHIYGMELPSVDDHILHTHLDSFLKDEEILLQLHPFANHFGMSSLPLTAESTHESPPLWVQGSSEPQDSPIDEQNNSPQFLNASMLVTEINEQIVLVKGDSRVPSLSGSEENSDKYHVGPILGLTRRLAAELRNSWRPELSVQDIQQQLRPASSFSTSAYPVCPEGMDFFSIPPSQQTPSEVLDPQSMSPEVPDFATNLLMLTGYASLTKLYTIAFSQIHNILKQLPESVSSSRNAPIPSHNLGKAEPLQPGELLAPPSPFDCSGVYITVQMLLDEFQAVEDIVSFANLHDPETPFFEKENNTLEDAQQQQQQQQLGVDVESQPGWLTRQIEMVRAGLKEDMVRTLRIGSQGELSSVLQYGHYLKILLRERMGL